MGLFKSVIADARPAKSVARSVYSPVLHSGQILQYRNSDHMVAGSGLNISAEFTSNPGKLENNHSSHKPTSFKNELPRFSSQSHGMVGDKGIGVSINKQGESITSSLPNKDAACLRQDINTAPIEQGSETTTQIIDTDDKIRRRQPERAADPIVELDADFSVLNNAHPDVEKQIDFYREKSIRHDGVTSNTIDAGDSQPVKSDRNLDKSHKNGKAFSCEKSTFPIKPVIEPPRTASEVGDNQKTGNAASGSLGRNAYVAAVSVLQPMSIVSGELVLKNESSNRIKFFRSEHDKSGEATKEQAKGVARSDRGKDTIKHDVSREVSEDAREHKQSAAVSQRQELMLSMENRAKELEVRTARNHVSENQYQRTPVIEKVRSAEVRVGQIDVYIEKTLPVTTTASRAARPSISMISRHYLRRL